VGAVYDARGQLRDQILDNVCTDGSVTTGVALQAFGNDILGPRAFLKLKLAFCMIKRRD
jgi:hypothetical protein